MKSRRDTLSILSDLLYSMKEVKRITHLLYASNLSYSQFVKYIKMIKSMGLIAEEKNPFHCYVVTEDGKIFMELINKRKNTTL